MEPLNNKEHAALSAAVETVMEAAMPSLIKIAAAMSGNKVVAQGGLFVSEPVDATPGLIQEFEAGDVRDYRKELWIRAYVLARGSMAGYSIAQCAEQGDVAMAEFDKRFPK